MPFRQRGFEFRERTERLDRRFKRALVVLTVLGVGGLVGGTPAGRYGGMRLAAAGRRAVRGALGFPEDRPRSGDEWRRRRERGVAHAREVFRQVYDEADPRMQRLLRFAGLDPGHAVLRWGNFDQTLLLPGTVFEPDDTGRSYRMRPNTRAVWLKGVDLPRHLSGFFLVPDAPELPRIIEGTGAYIVAGSTQTTNSWGLRGPEPDPTAPVRGLILGDSNVQGLFLGDDETPPACLARELERLLHERVSLVNTGHLGYSPEQFYHCLVEYADRFRPQFVLLTLCPNDFGDAFATLQGVGDWDEGRYWLAAIRQFCTSRNLLLVTSPMPVEMQITGLRAEGYYPGLACNAAKVDGLLYCNPIEDFVDEHIRLRLEAWRTGRAFSTCPLYNGHIGDHHFSAPGAALWGRSLGRRLSLLLETRRARGAPGP